MKVNIYDDKEKPVVYISDNKTGFNIKLHTDAFIFVCNELSKVNELFSDILADKEVDENIPIPQTDTGLSIKSPWWCVHLKKWYYNKPSRYGIVFKQSELHEFTDACLDVVQKVQYLGEKVQCNNVHGSGTICQSCQ